MSHNGRRSAGSTSREEDKRFPDISRERDRGNRGAIRETQNDKIIEYKTTMHRRNVRGLLTSLFVLILQHGLSKKMLNSTLLQLVASS